MWPFHAIVRDNFTIKLASEEKGQICPSLIPILLHAKSVWMMEEHTAKETVPLMILKVSVNAWNLKHFQSGRST